LTRDVDVHEEERMLAIRSAHLFDGESFAPGPATVILDAETITGVEPGLPDLPAEIAVLHVGEATGRLALRPPAHLPRLPLPCGRSSIGRG
jgi:hypothetical protein